MMVITASDVNANNVLSPSVFNELNNIRRVFFFSEKKAVFFVANFESVSFQLLDGVLDGHFLSWFVSGVIASDTRKKTKELTPGKIFFNFFSF